MALAVHPMAPRPNAIRFPVDPRDVPPEKAARRLHLTLAEFNEMLPDLHARAFPRPDVTTGMYDLVAIDRWMDTRSGLAPTLTTEAGPRNASDGFSERVARLANGH
jgi:hypothetical protein